MNTIKFEKGNIGVVAHRGLSGIERENTASAFVAAGNRSYYGVETDIRRTSDGHFIISHDISLARVGGVDVNVEKTTLEELQNIVLLDKDNTKGRVDLRPCTLENYISICKKYEKHCVLELKSDFTDEEIVQILDIVKGFDYLENVTFISFIYSNMTKIRKVCPKQSVQFLFSKFDDEILARLISDRIGVDVQYKALTKEMIALLHENSLEVNCWTVDDKDAAEQLCDWGVDYITTNILEQE